MDKTPKKITLHDGENNDDIIIVYDKKSPLSVSSQNLPGEHLRECCFNHLHECTCDKIKKYKKKKFKYYDSLNNKQFDKSSGIDVSQSSSCSSDNDSYWLKTKSFSYTDSFITPVEKKTNKEKDMLDILKTYVDEDDEFDKTFSSFDSTKFQTLLLNDDDNDDSHICSLLNKTIIEMSDDSSDNQLIIIFSQIAHKFDENPDEFKERLITIIEESTIYPSSPSDSEKKFILIKNISKLIENESKPSVLESNIIETSFNISEDKEFIHLEILCNSAATPRKIKSPKLRRSISTPNFKILSDKNDILKKCQAQQQSLDDYCVGNEINKSINDIDSTQENLWDTYYGGQVFSPKNYTSDLSKQLESKKILTNMNEKKNDIVNDVSIINPESPKTPENDELLHSKMLHEKSAAPRRSKSPFYLTKKVSLSDLKISKEDEEIKKIQKQQLDNFVDNIDLNDNNIFDDKKSSSNNYSIDSCLQNNNSQQLIKSIITEVIKKRENCLQKNLKKINKSSNNKSILDNNKLKEILDFIKEAEKYLNYLKKHEKTIKNVIKINNKNQSSDSGVCSPTGNDSNVSSTSNIITKKKLIDDKSLKESKSKYLTVDTPKKKQFPNVIITPETPINKRHSIISSSTKFFNLNTPVKQFEKIIKPSGGRFFVTPRKSPTKVSTNLTYETYLGNKTIKSPVGEYIKGNSPNVHFQKSQNYKK